MSDVDKPAILCISRVYRGPRERLAIEQRGGRLVYINDNLELVIQELDFLLTEAATLRAIGPRIQILYRLREDGTEVAMVSLVHRSRIYHLRLAARARILVDHLAKYKLPQSAAQIQADIRLSHVKVYIQRIRQAFAQAFREAAMDTDPNKVLVSEPYPSHQHQQGATKELGSR